MKMRAFPRCQANPNRGLSQRSAVSSTCRRPSCLLTASPAVGLRLKQVSVPGYSRTGDTVTLQCLFDLEGDQLYNVKWYKGSKEFFRYVLADSPPKQVFELPGVSVDRDRSSVDTVVLSDVTPTSSGNYKCEVSAEAPSFHTDSGSGKLLVVALPKAPPRLSGVQRQYHVGDFVSVNCSSRSKPAAALSWYINEVKAEKAYLVDYAPVRSMHDLETSTLGLQFHARERHLSQGVLTLRCGATIASVYYNDTKVDVMALLSTNPTSLNGREKLTGGSCARHGEAVWAVVAAITLVIAALR